MASSIDPTKPEAGNATTESVRSNFQFAKDEIEAVQASSGVSFLQAGTGAVSRTVQSKLRDTVSVLGFGVVGDGSTDDTVNFQKALTHGSTVGDTIVIPNNISIRTTAHLWAYGTFDLIGESLTSEIIMDGDLAALSEGNNFWFNFGISAKQTNAALFTGKISNLKITATTNARVHRLLAFHRAYNYEVSNCYIDVTAVPSNLAYNTSGIGGNNDNSWCTGPSRTNGRMLNNHIIGSQLLIGGEGIGVGNATDIIISGNYIHGFADDAIGCHAIDKLSVTDNFCYTVDGRILLESCSNVRVTGNYCERIASPVDSSWAGSGALIHVNHGFTGQPAPTNIVISENEIFLPASVPSSTYCMRLQGLRNAVISDNIIINDSTNTDQLGIIVETDTLSGWTDPTGLDSGTTATPRNIVINDNILMGLYPPTINQAGSNLTGPFFVDGNIAGGFRFFSNTHYGNNTLVGSGISGTHDGSNNVAVLSDSTAAWVVNDFIGRTLKNVTDGSKTVVTANTATTITGVLAGGTDDDWDTSDAYTITTDTSLLKLGDDIVSNGTLLYEGYLTGAAPSTTKPFLRAGGLHTRFYAERTLRVLYLDVVLDTAVTTDNLVVRVYVDGVQETTKSFGTNLHQRIYMDNTDLDVNVVTGSYIEVKLVGDGTLAPALFDAAVSVYGTYVSID